jgi:hypothetical protein
VFGNLISYILLILILVLPMIVLPFTLGTFEPALMLMAVYAIPMALIIAFIVLPAVSIGLTRIYMILSADDEDLMTEEIEDEGGPSFIGGL